MHRSTDPRGLRPPRRASALRRAAALRLAALAVAALAGCHPPLPPAPPPPGATALWADLAFIGDPDRAGRQLGSPGRDTVALYIAERFREAGLLPATAAACAAGPPCERGYRQPFAVSSQFSSGTGVNVIGVVPGTDPARRGRAVVVGAHYDHVGRLGALARDPERPGVRPGADDNASGTAALLELARRLARRPAPRTVVFVAFDAEELGLFGSEHFVDHPTPALDSVVAMLNLDMVGRLRPRGLIVRGAASDDRWEDVLARANRTVGLELRLRPAGGASDHMSFLQAGIPSLHFFTGLHPQYHTRADRVETLNVAGIVRVVELVEGVVREVAEDSRQ